MSEAKPLPPKENYWAIRLRQAAEALQANNFDATIHAAPRDAAAHLMEAVLPAGWTGSVGLGGSQTVIASGILDMLKARPGVNLIDTYDRSRPREEIIEMRRQSLLADLFIASSNAVTMAGQLLNLDMIGNRVGAIHFGPRKVALFVGRNKLCDTMEQARERVKHLASPMNTMRIGSKTPCVKTARCSECKSPERICNVWTVTEKSYPPQRIHVLLINQDLGF